MVKYIVKRILILIPILLAVSFVSIYLNDYYYEKTGGAMPWNEAQDYVSKGGIYPFLHSFQEMIFTAPEGYEQQKAEDLLNSYQDADIAEDQKVSVMGIMLEAFCDLTDFEVLAQQDSVMDVYAPWHALEEQSVSGRLLTNIFAGGTVDTEWAFLTGYSNHSDFIQDTDSYVWYLDGQGYQTFGSHPGFGWFYDRQSINEFLGFQEYWFTENHYGDLVDPVAAQWNSDHVLMEELLKQLSERVQDGPCFSFSVSYQNHGPYEWQYTIADEYTTTVKISFADGVSAVESAVGATFTWKGETITSGMPSFDKTFFDKVFVTSSGTVSANITQFNKLVNALVSGVTLFEVEVSTTGEYGSKTDTYEIKVTSDGLHIRVEGIELGDTSIIF